MLHFQFAEYFYVLLGAPILVIAFISVLVSFSFDDAKILATTTW